MVDDLIQQTCNYVKSKVTKAEKGHDWWHVYRVWKLCLLILKTETADSRICQLGALLHDIADYKFHEGDDSIGVKLTTEFLQKQNVSPEETNKVVNIIQNISYKGGMDMDISKSAELKVVQDADRLDALGAIGIARTFHYGGYKNREIYNPEIPPVEYHSVKEYLNSQAPTLNHFYEKLLNLKNLMNTATGKRIAEARHAFMLKYLEQFYSEWNLSD